jgi:hypothetical protein
MLEHGLILRFDQRDENQNPKGRAADKLCVVATAHPVGCPAFPTRLPGGLAPVDPRPGEAYRPPLTPSFARREGGAVL